MVQWRERMWLLAFYPLETIKKRSYLIGFILFLIFVLSGSQLFHAHADEDSELSYSARSERQTLTSDTQMSEALRRALFDHPSVRQAGARSCRAVFVLGQRKAERRPQLSASVSGARELAKNYRTNQDDRTKNNIPIRSSSRAYDNERNDLYDLEVSARYRLYDWGVGDSLVRGETNRLHAERLTYEMQLARISLSAYDVSRYGSLEGSVIHVASNTTQEENAPPYYETMIAISDKQFANTGIVPDIVLGMQVTVDIIGGKRTVLGYILSPIERATAVAFRKK